MSDCFIIVLAGAILGAIVYLIDRHWKNFEKDLDIKLRLEALEDRERARQRGDDVLPLPDRENRP